MIIYVSVGAFMVRVGVLSQDVAPRFFFYHLLHSGKYVNRNERGMRTEVCYFHFIHTRVIRQNLTVHITACSLCARCASTDRL